MNTKLPSIRVAPGEMPLYLLLPGDPARAARIAEYLDGAEVLARNREFHSYRGSYRGIPVGVLSTGVGAPGAAVACEEAIRAGARVLIRVGTAGSLTERIRDGDLVIALGAARCEGTTPRLVPAELPALAHPRVVRALEDAAAEVGEKVHTGVVVTMDPFYRGVLDLGLETFAAAGAVAVEMECAALFVVASLRGARAGAILAIDGNALRASAGEYDPHREVVRQAVEREIRIALEAVYRLAREKGARDAA